MNIDEIFLEAKLEKASDIHLVNNLPVFFRIDGLLKPTQKWPILNSKIILSLIKTILSQHQEKIFFEKKELDCSYQVGATRFRINLFWEKGHPSLSARIIPRKIPTLEDINMMNIGPKLANLRQGLIIITGPTGCGKSTTLAAIIDYINKNKSVNIITLEDPIEFDFASKKSIVVQRELGKDMLSFAAALKHIVRQDPNVIMVGEMRDLETISLAITLAETGHLILATLHTPNTSQAIDRIIDIFPASQQSQIRLQISTCLKAVVAQQLIPKKDGGRIAVREILINTPAVASLIREHKSAQLKSVIQTGAQKGMFTLEQNLKELYKNKIISLKTAMSYTTDKEALLDKEFDK